MAAPHMTAKIQKAFKEHIADISANDLEQFVKIPDTQPGGLATSFTFNKNPDFHLAFLGVSTKSPTPSNTKKLS